MTRRIMSSKIWQFFIKISKFIIHLNLHLTALAAIVWAFLPIAKWYINFRPLWGVDFFLTVNVASLISGHFVMPYALWNYAGFGGWPQFIYPTLLPYIIVAISNFFDIVMASQIAVMGSALLFAFGAYFLFFRLSKNQVISAIFATFTALSGGVYQTLTWAGSLPSFASQAGLPWSLGFLIWYKQTKKIKYLLMAAALGGISVWFHPLVFVVYIIPATFIVLFSDFTEGLKLLLKIRDMLIFAVVAIAIGLPLFYTTFQSAFTVPIQTKGSDLLSTTAAPKSELEIGIEAFNRAQVKRAVTDNNMAIFLVLGVCATVYLASFLISIRLKSLVEILPYLLLVGYFAFYLWIFGEGISIYHGGWYRVFWPIPIWVGVLGSVLWGNSYINLTRQLLSKYSRFTFVVFSSIILAAFGILVYTIIPPSRTISQIVFRSQASSAYPDMLNVRVTDAQREEVKKIIVPAWMNGDETNYRLYDGDQTVNLWWNSLFKMPLARGYIDPPLNSEKRGYLFLLDTALSESEGEPQMVKAFNYPAETAISNALFLIDWNAIGYFEGGHVGGAFAPMPHYLEDLIVSKKETVDLNADKYTKRHVTFNFYEIKRELTSPILAAVNTPALGIFASENGYETVVRSIAERNNLNSQKIIPVNLGRTIDSYNLSDLKNFDALYLYDYNYKQDGKAFKMLTDYAQAGRKIILDTGVEGKQSEGDLPELFPVKRVERGGQGREWDLQNTMGVFGQNVDFSKFAPPVFDEDEWKISHANADDLRSGASTFLTNHGKIVGAKQTIGSGEVIWVGINLAYHLSRNHIGDEAIFFQNILSEAIDFSQKPGGQYQAVFVNSNRREITTSGSRAILFKEQAYSGWEAYFEQNGKSGHLKIYKAGPAYPGYMYIPLPSASHSKVTLEYRGSMLAQIFVAISIVTALFIFDEFFFFGKTLGAGRRFVWKRTRRYVGKWWEREDEG